jgi:hypothetical protein
MSEVPPLPTDDLAQRLRESIRKQRPRRTRVLLLFMFPLLLPLALLAWWFWPWSRPPELIVVGFDHIAQPGQPVLIRAATQPLEEDPNRWGGQQIFMEEMTLNPADRVKAQEVRTNSDGVAVREWTIQAASPVTEIEVRYVDERLRPPWFSRDRIRVFTWPQNSRLLAIDVVTLKKTDDWPAMAQALARASSAGWHLVYLGFEAEAPLAFAKLRDWLILQITADSQPIPDGPVLSRPILFQTESPKSIRQSALTKLTTDFAGPVYFYQNDQGLTLQRIGPDTQPLQLKGWTDLASALPK